MFYEGMFPLASRLARHAASLVCVLVWERAKASHREMRQRGLVGTAKHRIQQPRWGVEGDGYNHSLPGC